MPPNLIVSDYELTEAGFNLVRLFQELKEDPQQDLTALLEEIDQLVGAMRQMGDQVDGSAFKIGLLEQQLEDAQKRHADLQLALQLAREDRDESLTHMELNWESEVSQLRSQIEEILREKNDMSIRLLESQQDLQDLRRDKDKLETYLTKVVHEKQDAVNLLRDKMTTEDENSDCSKDLEELAILNQVVKAKTKKNSAMQPGNLVSVSLQTEGDDAALPTTSGSFNGSLDETLKELEMVKEELRNRLMNSSPESDISQNSAVSLMEELAEINAIDSDEAKLALGNLWAFSQSYKGDGNRFSELPIIEDSNLLMANDDVFLDQISDTDTKSGSKMPVWSISEKDGKLWFSQLLFWLCLYLLLDIIYFHAFGVHIFTVNRIDRGRRTAIF